MREEISMIECHIERTSLVAERPHMLE
jgi:hypothetical protein